MFAQRPEWEVTILFEEKKASALAVKEEGKIAVIDSNNNREINRPDNRKFGMAGGQPLEEDISPYGLIHRSFFIDH